MKLKITNSWESLYWEIDGIDVTAVLRKVTLELPDKFVQDFKVTWVESRKQYYDMGISCSVVQLNAFITLVVNGLKIKTNLMDIKSKVKVIDYKVRRP